MFDIGSNLLSIALEATMLRHRLVRQGAVSINSSTESTNMSSPPPLRRRLGSQDSSKMYRQLSSDSLDSLISMQSSCSNEDSRRSGGGRRHSVAGGALCTGDTQKPSLKSAFNSAVRRMSDACSLLSSAPSSTYNLSSPTQICSLGRKKENEVILPQVLGTFRQSFKPQNGGDKNRNNLLVNRRFSTDCPPPSYNDATGSWKQTVPKQNRLTRQHEVLTSKASLVAVEDVDSGNPEE